MNNLYIKCLKSEKIESGSMYGQFLINSLRSGQGITVGNILRRVLLSDLGGTAITSVRIAGVRDEFSIIPGVREDILEILLNLKQIILKTKYTDKISGKIIAKGPGIITANCLKFDNEVEIINPNQYIAAISTAQNIEFDIIAERGVGYQLADQTEQKAKDFLQIDAVFMPVVKVNYKINNIYVSHNKTNESLLLEITTNGSITPEKAVSEAAKKLMIWFSSLTNEENLKPEQIDIQQTIPQPEVILIEELQLPVRAYNCLKRAGINSVDELIQYSQEEIKEIKNFGKKSADEVFQALKKKFNIILPSLKS